MRVAKRFRWEAAHRLPWYEGSCQHLHGHSYRMVVEVEGKPGERGMLIDLKELKEALQPLIDSWDHATLIAQDDEELKSAIEEIDLKYYVLPFDTTAENLCKYVAAWLGAKAFATLKDHGITTIRVRIHETETCYAEIERPLSAYSAVENDCRLKREWRSPKPEHIV